MPTLTALERRSLRAKAHHLHPVVAIGTHGLTAAVLHEIDVALKAHELIKIRVWSDERSDREALLDEICRTLDCAPVQHLGKLLIVWRRNPELHREAAKAAPRPVRTPAKRRVPSASNDRRAEDDASVGMNAARIDHVRVRELALDIANARLDEALPLLGGVVIGVLRDIAVRAGFRERTAHRRPLDRLQSLQLGFEALGA